RVGSDVGDCWALLPSSLCLASSPGRAAEEPVSNCTSSLEPDRFARSSCQSKISVSLAATSAFAVTAGCGSLALGRSGEEGTALASKLGVANGCTGQGATWHKEMSGTSLASSCSSLRTRRFFMSPRPPLRNAKPVPGGGFPHEQNVYSYSKLSAP